MRLILKTRADIVGGILIAVLLLLIVVGTLAGSALAAMLLTFLAGFLPTYLGVLLATYHPMWGKRIAVFCLVVLVAFVSAQVTLILNSSDAFSWYGYNTAVGIAAQGAFMGFGMATLYGLFGPNPRLRVI